MKKTLPIGKALSILFGSIAFCLTLALLVFFYIHHVGKKQKSDPKFNIVALAQATGENQGLKTVYLAELLELSVDHPQNLYRFNLQEALRKLKSSSLIKEAEITKVKPGTLYIEYVLRKPVAFLGDFTNTALDAEGYLIPFKPFFTPKKLPEIFLGLSSFGDHTKENDEESGKWGAKVQGQRAALALKIFKIIQQQCCSETVLLQRIDVSKAYALSYGQRQIVAILEEKVPTQAALVLAPRILRLSEDNYMQELANYNALRSFLNEKVQNNKGEKGIVKANPVIIDLRAPHLAYIKGT